jgi:hypothetical protein
MNSLEMEQDMWERRIPYEVWTKKKKSDINKIHNQKHLLKEEFLDDGGMKEGG